jgi:hypothetical protein
MGAIQESETMSATPSTTEPTTQANLPQDDESGRDNVSRIGERSRESAERAREMAKDAYSQASRWLEDNYRSPVFVAGAVAVFGVIGYLIYRGMRESESIELS